LARAPALNRSCGRPHAHSVASNEDAYRGSSPLPLISRRVVFPYFSNPVSVCCFIEVLA
jgi:hypothetical protein